MKRSAYIGNAGVIGGYNDSVVYPQAFYPQTRLSGPHRYTIPVDGLYKFYVWGSGGPGGSYTKDDYQSVYVPGGTGSLSIAELLLSAGSLIDVTVPTNPYNPTTVALPGGRNLVAGPGGPALIQPDGSYLPGVGGTATGGDINIPGSSATVSLTFGIKTSPDGGGNNPGLGGFNGGRDTPSKTRYIGGPGAPGYDEFKGGDGRNYYSNNGGVTWEGYDDYSFPGAAAHETMSGKANGFVIIKRIG